MGNPTNGPDGLPEVRDEAGDTPYWVPGLGLGLLAVLAIFMAIRITAAPDGPTEVQVAVQAPEEAESPPPVVAPPEPEPAEAANEDSFGRSPGEEHFGHDHP